jgi:hypothetical protein
MTGTLAITLGLVLAATGQDRRPTIPSSTVERKVTKLTTEITWLSSLDEARARALKENKPILWLHALGDLDGVC